MKIRPATAEDLAALAALHAVALPPGWSAESIAALLKTPQTQAFVADGEEVVGFVMLRTAADEAEILTIAVDATRQRRGAGQALLAAAIADARGRGAATLHLEVASNNDGARAFYATAGFVESGRRARYYPDGADALLLSLDLA